jgi:L-fuculose-phosphate aldolase
MVEISSLLYARFLTNSAGGNISCRVGDHIYITPRGLGSRHRWRLSEDMVVVTDIDRNPVVGDPAMISREGQMHYACYRHFPEIHGVVHAHARELSVFAAQGVPLTPTLEYTRKFGVVDVVPALPAHTAEVADAVVQKLEPRRETLSRNGLGLILAGHGAVTVGRDLADAFDVMDRLEWSAHILLMQRLLNAPADRP